MSSRAADFIIIFAYLAVMLAVGAYFRRFNRDSDDYFRSGSQGTWWLVGMSLFMGAFSAWTFTGAAGLAYEAGYSVVSIYLANALGLLLNFAFLAAWLRQLRATTTPEVIEKRFNESTRQFYAWVNVVLQLLYSSLFLYGLSIFASAVYGFDVNATIVVLGLIVMVYCTVGGTWGIMATDFLQGLVLLPVTLVLAGVCLYAVGGFGGLFEAVHAAGLEERYALVKEPGLFPGAQYTLPWLLAMLLKNIAGYLSLNSAVRFFSVKDGREAKKAALLAAVLMILGSLVWFIPPVTARVLFSDAVEAMALSKPAESAYAVASLKLLPNGLTGLMVVAMFAATMSSMDSGINRNAAILVRDIYPRLCLRLNWSPLPAPRLLVASQIVSLLLGVAVILLAIYFAASEGRGIFEHMLTLGALLTLPMAIPMVMGLFVKRVPPWAAIVSAGCAFLVNGIVTLSGWKWNFQEQVFINAAVGVSAFLACRFGWGGVTADYKTKVDNFFRIMRTPVDFEREVGASSDLRQARVVGGFALAIGLAMFGLLLLPNASSGRWMIAGVAAFTAGTGALMCLAAESARRRALRRREEQAAELAV
jgi:solute:Na+ symporter, SSS family